MEVPPPPPRCIVSTAITAGDGSILIGDPYSLVVRLYDLKEKRLRKEMHFLTMPTFLVFRESLVPHDFFQLPRCPELIRLKFPD
jgi:hypothetical protein